MPLELCLASLSRDLAHRIEQAEVELPQMPPERLEATRMACLTLSRDAVTLARMVAQALETQT